MAPAPKKLSPAGAADPTSNVGSDSLPSVNPAHLIALYAVFVLLNAHIRSAFITLTNNVKNVIVNEDGSVETINETHTLVATVVFAAAFVFNVNAALWSLHPTRYRLNVQVAYISAVAAWTHYQMYVGQDWYVTMPGAYGRMVSFSGLRQLEWVFTTPVLLLLVQNLHAYAFAALPTTRLKNGSGGKHTYNPVSRFSLIVVDELMILGGLVIPLTSGMERWFFLVLSVLCFCYVIGHSVRALMDIMKWTEMSMLDAGRMYGIALLKVVAWGGYPVIFFLTEGGFITCKEQHDLYLYNDVLTKFSYTLIISAGSLRFIEVLDEQRTVFAMHMSRVQRAFFFNITHELRTPLNSIIGFNTLAMESGELTEFTESFIKASLTSAEALLGLINQILDFAKFEGAKDKSGGSESSIELSEDVWTLRQLVEQVTDISQKASSRGVDLIIDIINPEHFNTRFIGDFFRLRQCCVNLVDNAIKYSSDVKGRNALVEFSMRVVKHSEKNDVCSVTFTVEDNGVGIPEAKQHTLFVPFCQPADHKVAKEKGTGLGLVITKSIIECMGGNIDFESVEDNGTKFFFTVDFHVAKDLSEEELEAMNANADDSDFVVEADTVDTLPSDARCIFHPNLNDFTKKHVTNILKCFGARPGINYVSVASESKVTEKVKQAGSLGVPIILTDVQNMNSTLEFIQSAPKAGVIIFGLPYQLIELHRKIAEKKNVVTVLKPVKPSDFQRAITKLTAMSQTGEMDWMHDSISDEIDMVKKLDTATENTVSNAMKDQSSGGDAAGASGGGGANGGAASEEGELKGMNILLVEDNAMNQQMAKFSIIKCGADLEIAGHGKDAVDIIQDRLTKKLPNYDCILMDMMMPVMDGATATVEIRKMEKKFGVAKPHTIVGLSANVGPEYTEQVKKAGMDGSMSKPFYPATLRNTLVSVKKGQYTGFSRTSSETGGTTLHSKPGN